MIEAIYDSQLLLIKDEREPCPLSLELLASFERMLCYCHTGNTAVLATSLMRPLGLSRGALMDGFPTLNNHFQQPTISLALRNGLLINPATWPLKDGYPAVASKKSQIVTYSLNYFLVRVFLYF